MDTDALGVILFIVGAQNMQLCNKFHNFRISFCLKLLKDGWNNENWT